MCHDVYFCTSKASKLSTSTVALVASASAAACSMSKDTSSRSSVRIGTFVPVKQVNRWCLASNHYRISKGNESLVALQIAGIRTFVPVKQVKLVPRLAPQVYTASPSAGYRYTAAACDASLHQFTCFTGTKVQILTLLLLLLPASVSTAVSAEASPRSQTAQTASLFFLCFFFRMLLQLLQQCAPPSSHASTLSSL